MKKPRIAVIGYGQFGRFMAKNLRPYGTIVPINENTEPKAIAHCDVVIFAVPFDSLPIAISSFKNSIKQTALILDVTSVKQKPLALLKKAFPKNEILGTHPIFGPQSGKHGIKGLSIVLCNVSFTSKHYTAIRKFLKNELELKVIEQTPKQHDTEMARVQALTHLIGRSIAELDIKSYATNTKSYEQLLELKELLKNDSWELFETIQNANPEAKIIRKEFIRTIKNIETKL